jgi:hypothetical protein
MIRISFSCPDQSRWSGHPDDLARRDVGMSTDLTGVTQDLNSRTFRTFELFALAAVLYYLIAKAVVLAARLVAGRMFRY